MSLINVAPDTAQYSLLPEKYAALLVALKANKDASKLVFSVGVAGAATGAVTYQGIDFAWQYDDVSQLTVKIIAVHNWKAKLAGNQVIFERLDADLISQV